MITILSLIFCISNCTLCSNLNSTFECLKCAEGYYYDGVQKCVYCNSSLGYYFNQSDICIYCDPNLNKFLDSTGNICETCILQNCTICENLSFCKICEPNFILNISDGGCILPCILNCTLCSNNILEMGEQCDDGNLQNGDGCSQNCFLEILSEDIIKFQVLQISKYDFTNQIQVRIEVYPRNSAFWQEVDFPEMMTISNTQTLDNYFVLRNLDGTISLYLNYKQDIQNKQITVQLDPKKSSRQQLRKFYSFSKSFRIIPFDNEKASYYTQDRYDLAKITQTISLIIGSLSIVFYILGLFSGKLIGVQLISVVQISCLALITIVQLNPEFKAISSLDFVNGFNYFSLSRQYLLDKKTPISVKGMKLFSLFIKNYNITGSFLLISYLISLILLVVSKICQKSTSDNIKYISKRICFQIAFNWLMFSGYIVGVSFGLQISYSKPQNQDFFSILSIIQCTVILSLFLLYFIFLIKFESYFGQFRSKFETRQNSRLSKISKVWYNILIIERLVIGMCLVFLIDNRLPLLFPIVIYSSLFILVIAARPYKQHRDNIRFGTNLLISIIILSIYQWHMENATSQNENASQSYLPIIVCCLLIVCVAYNAIALLYELLLLCRKIKTKEMNIVQLNVPQENITEQNIAIEKKMLDVLETAEWRMKIMKNLKQELRIKDKKMQEEGNLQFFQQQKKLELQIVI